MKDTKILIIDDSKLNCAVFMDVLESRFDVTEASSGEAAVKILTDGGADVDLILLDMYLDDIDGMEFLKRIKKSEKYKNVPVVLIAQSGADSSMIHRACELGAADFISRPFFGDIIMRRIENVLSMYPGHVHHAPKSTLSEYAVMRTAEQLEAERKKRDFFLSLATDIWFEYNFKPSALSLSRKAALMLGIPQVLKNPLANEHVRTFFSDEQLKRIISIFFGFSAENTYFEGEIPLTADGKTKIFRLSVQAIWDAEENAAVSAFGVLADINKGFSDLEKIQNADKMPGACIPLSAIDGDFPRLTMEQASALLRYLKKMFSVVRLVDPEICMQFCIDDMGKIIERPYRCYTVWNRETRCENCISAIVSQNHKTMTKLEFVNDEVYNVTASYINVDGKAYVLEIASYVDHDAMFSAGEKQHLLNTIAAHNRQLYIDPVTGVYNRRYYDDRLRDLHGTFAFAMLDMDNFKQINDSCGHLAGDAALKAAAQAIKENVRPNDDVIRFGGDEFFLLLKNMPADALKRKLEKILHAVENVSLPEYPGVKLTVSIGGACEEGKISQILRKADLAMYEAKVSRNSICMYEDKHE